MVRYRSLASLQRYEQYYVIGKFEVAFSLIHLYAYIPDNIVYTNRLSKVRAISPYQYLDFLNFCQNSSVGSTAG